MHKSTAVDYTLLFTLALIWSTSFLLIKIGLESFAPFTLTSGRLVIAAVMLSGYQLIRRQRLPLNRDALLIYAVVGIIGNALPFSLISLGEVYIDSALAAILMGIMPIATFALAHFLIPSEPITRRKLLGVGCGFFGLAALLGRSALGGIGDQLLGQLVVLVGALCYAAVAIFVRRQPALKGLDMATGAIIVGAISCLPAALLLESRSNISVDLVPLLAMITLGVFHTAISARLYFRVIGNLGAVTFAQINYLIPVLGSIWGVMILDERLSWRIIIALCLVLVGIYFIQPKQIFQAEHRCS